MWNVHNNLIWQSLAHIDKGCLSGIPPSCGTNRNENLHRQMNRHFHTGRLGILFAYALMSVLLYAHNNKVNIKGKNAVPPVLNTSSSDGNSDSESEVECFGVFPKTDNLCSNVHDQCIGRNLDQDQVPSDIDSEKLLETVKKSILYAASFTEFQGLANFNNDARIVDWMQSNKIRPILRDDINSREMDMHNETLRGNLHTRRLKLFPVPEDGNCFFHSPIVAF